MSGPLHEGELAMQRRAGAHPNLPKLAARMIRDYMPDQHRTFFEQLPFVVLGTVDDAGDVWASLVAGRPGFLRSPDPRTLAMSVRPDPTDPAAAGFREGASVGLLGIELPTRRRNRMNGVVHEAPLRVDVVHSFGNCPQYIQTRELRWVDEPAGAVQRATTLSDADRAFIRHADTFHVASYVDPEHIADPFSSPRADAPGTANTAPDGSGTPASGPARSGASAAPADGRQVDVSHRGGKPGFVHVDEHGTLTVPDFSGNNLFNTLGNLLVNPRAGLVFVDWARGDVLQLTGRTEILFDAPEIALFEGASRLWRVHPSQVVRRPGALALRGRLLEASPRNATTGSWDEVERRREAGGA